jgi:hypothetical protein
MIDVGRGEARGHDRRARGVGRAAGDGCPRADEGGGRRDDHAEADRSWRGEPWRIQRRLLRTFSTTPECEEQKESFIGVHVRRVEGHGLITASGAPPVVEVESIECFTLRGDTE